MGFENENETEVLEPVAEEPVAEEPVTEEPVVEEVAEEVAEEVVEEVATEEIAIEEPAAKKHSHAFAGIFTALFIIVGLAFFVTIYNVKNPSYTYYDSDGAAVAVVEFDGGGDDLISAWNVCAADTMEISDEAKAQLEAEGKSLIFNDYVVKVSDTKAVIATGAGTADEKDYAVIKTVQTTDEEGNVTEVSIDDCVENLAVAITSGAYTRVNNNWILRFFK